jgi:hypothetical protein
VNPEAAPPDQDALDLVAGIERASRRSRPFFMAGLLAVILGFASVSVYLYQDREEERAQKIVLERQVAELSRTLNEARALGPSLDDSAAARERLRILLGEAIGTAQALPADVAQAESDPGVRNPADPGVRNPAAPAPEPPREARQRPEATPRPERPLPGADRPERRPGDARRAGQGARRAPPPPPPM